MKKGDYFLRMEARQQDPKLKVNLRSCLGNPTSEKRYYSLAVKIFKFIKL